MRLMPPISFQPRLTLLATLVALSLMTGCSFAPEPPYLLYAGPKYAGPKLPDSQVATLKWVVLVCDRSDFPSPSPFRADVGIATVLEIDGWPFPEGWGGRYVTDKKFHFLEIHKCRRAAKLLPGRHTIVYGARSFDTQSLHRPIASINLRAGHSYLPLVWPVVYDQYLGDNAHFWIQDMTTGEVVHGTPPRRR